jgi:hypothetical protein
VDSNGHDTVTRSDGVALSFDHLRSNVATGRIDASTQSEGDADVDCFGGNMRDLNNGGKNRNPPYNRIELRPTFSNLGKKIQKHKEY